MFRSISFRYSRFSIDLLSGSREPQQASISQLPSGLVFGFWVIGSSPLPPFSIYAPQKETKYHAEQPRIRRKTRPQPPPEPRTNPPPQAHPPSPHHGLRR